MPEHILHTTTTVIDPSDNIDVAPQAQVKSKTSAKLKRSQPHHAASLCDYELDNDSEIDVDDAESSSGCWMSHATKFIPPFTGESEKWEVWFAQFEVVANNQQWMTEQQLSALLPLLCKSASEFAFSTLSKDIWSNYKTLVKELTTRYWHVESKKGYQAKWSSIKQTPSQSEEQLAAHIKWVYKKAFPGWDPQAWKEDLLAKFYDALSDNNAKLAVEFTKDPNDIDEAVDYVVHYKETWKSWRSDDGGKYGQVRNVKMNDDMEYCDDQDIETDNVIWSVQSMSEQPSEKKNNKESNSDKSQTSEQPQCKPEGWQILKCKDWQDML